MASLELNILSEIQAKFENMTEKMNETDQKITENEEELLRINSKIIELNQRTSEISETLDKLKAKRTQFKDIHDNLMKNYDMIKQSAESLLSIVESHESV
jgi:uncharacterized coiled-coil DUF342 family protein